jgi:hypothetical protein
VRLSSFLKKNFGTVAFTTGGNQRLFALDFIFNLSNNKRVEQFCDYRLENYIDAECTLPPPVCSECTASALRAINTCELFHVHFNALFTVRIIIFLFLYRHCDRYRMRPTAT